jgi:hypothetical protein
LLPPGLFSEEQEAARAYDAALVRLKGMAAATNYSLACYQQQLAEHYQLKMVRHLHMMLQTSLSALYSM